MIKYIGLTGVAQCGKNAVGDILVRDYGYVNISPSDKIREALYELNPIIAVQNEIQGYSKTGICIAPVTKRAQDLVDQHGWDKARELYPEIRLLQQRMGTDVARNLWDQDFWVKLTMKDLPEKAVFTSVRFDNEALAIKEAGGVIWKIERPGYKAINEHVSDLGINPELVDSVIKNDGSLEDLENKVHAHFRPGSDFTFHACSDKREDYPNIRFLIS